MPFKIPMKLPLLIACLACLGLLITSASGEHWRDADRSSAGLAPDPEEFKDAVIQVYAARTFGWRGNFAVHTWLATKPEGADHYTVHHVVGWRSRRNLSVVVSDRDLPDRLWYGNKPVVLVDMRGEAAEKLMPNVLDAVASYPFADRYILWPGPNSNTFTAYVGREVPELKLDLPSTAIGKDYLTGTVLDNTPGGSGYQFSLFGLLGLSLAAEEGLEINILGLNFGVNPLKLHLKLPVVGTVGRPFYVEAAEKKEPGLLVGGDE